MKATQLELNFLSTRNESWEEKRKTLGRQKQSILDEFIRCGDRGATIAEIAAAVADGHSNRVCQAIKDLRGAELIKATGMRRAMPGGRDSVVMVASDFIRE